MNNVFISTTKYLFLAFLAFVVPKMIVDSGRIVAPLEPNDAVSNDPQGEKKGFWPFRIRRSSEKTSASNQAPSVDSSVDSNGNAVGTTDPLNSAFGREKYGANSSDLRYSPSPFVADASFDGAAFSSRNADGIAAERVGEKSLPGSYPNPFFVDSDAFLPTPTRTFEEIFRFGKSPSWLTERWARVDLVSTDSGLVGYRVVVSTGVDVDDLVGVLTCYFDATSERRIVFSGQTGDYRKILRFLEQECGVALAPDSTAARLRYESTLKTSRPESPPSRLIVQPTRVFLRGSEKSFFDVDVVLEKP